ncbi:MAG: YqhA family protein [Chlorobium sp.]|uniref:YqhA family protein n=1 Tax=Chlorobium sp. TaxID=1095 RepID=UPI002F3E7736
MAFLRRLLSSTRYLIIIAVAGTFLSALTLIIYGGISVVQQIADTILDGAVSAKGAKSLALGFIENADLFLVATALYIMSLGLYELFIDDTIKLPEWLIIHNLDDLKSKLIGVIVVVMAVIFLGHVVKWHGETEILYLGGAIGIVVAGLTYFTGQKKKGKYEEKH